MCVRFSKSVCIILLLHTCRCSKSETCTLNIQSDLDTSKDPLILEADGRNIVRPQVKNKNGVIHVNAEDEIILACPGRGNYNKITRKTSSHLECSKDGKFYFKENPDRRLNLKTDTNCQKSYACSSPKITNINCGHGSTTGKLIQLGFQVNCYYYEVYFVLSNLYQQVLSQQSVVKQISGYQSVLQFLQTYKRISSPSEAEQEQWFQLFPNKNQLPQISNFRLPFTPFFAKESPWGILKPELSLKTYKTWFNIIPQLGLDRDMLCTLTIQRLSSDQLSGGFRGKSQWHLQSCNSSVLHEIQECVQNIHNQEMASAALYYVVNHMPPGADQMAAATLCYMQAEQWILQDKSEKARAGFAKVEKKYLTVCTSHILHSSGLGRQEYLQLVLHPQELIVALYNDPSILQRRTGTLTHCPELCSLQGTTCQWIMCKIHINC